MIILGIDTSCDDTSIAVSRDRTVLANCISSQDSVHQEFGGVVPMLAKREHHANFQPVLMQALTEAGISIEDVDRIAITIGPGLAPALEIGVELAEQLAATHSLPIEPIHHMEGHLLSSLATNQDGSGGLDPSTVTFPALGILASGGHTEIVLISDWGKYEILGETVDDALGEAYDKVARMLGLGFPGGGKLAQLASFGNPRAYDLPLAMLQSGDCNVSYSGIKTATKRLIYEVSQNATQTLTTEQTQDIAASFQRAALFTFLKKIQKVLEKYPVNNVLLGGGVAVNTVFQEELERLLLPYEAKLSKPVSSRLCQDNGAMIAVAAYIHSQAQYHLPIEKLDRRPQWRLDDYSSALDFSSAL